MIENNLAYNTYLEVIHSTISSEKIDLVKKLQENHSFIYVTVSKKLELDFDIEVHLFNINYWPNSTYSTLGISNCNGNEMLANLILASYLLVHT